MLSKCGGVLAMFRRMGVVAVLLLLSAHSLAQLQSERFDIDRFNVDGNTLLHPDEIEVVLAPFTGKQRQYRDVQGAIEALGQRYRKEGFSVVWVLAPEQDIDQGVVTLQVIEARIGEVTISGNRFFSDANVRSSLPSLKEDVSPRIGDLSANVQLVNGNPAKQVDVVLRPSEAPAVVDATIEVIDVQPRKFFLTLDNTGNKQTGDYRLGVGVQHANLYDRDHIGTLSYVTSPESPGQVGLFSGSYRLPLYSWGDSIDFIAAYSDVSIGTTATVAGPLTFTGQGTVYSVRYNQLLKRQGEYSHRIVYGIDYRAFKNECALGDFGEAGCGPTAVDVTTTPISVAYSGNLASLGTVSDFYIAVSRNIPWAGQGQSSNFNAARPSPSGGDGASADYAALRFGASTVRAFENNWQVQARVNAQLSSNALIFGEQFGITGATAVRGFRERELVRDIGLVANLELYSPNLAGRLIPGEGNAKGLLFYDFAVAADQPLDGEDERRITVGSIGAGFRWNLYRNLNVRFDLARVVNEGGSRQSGDLHGHISVFVGF
ncbi:MAG: ShlB/FhaC/HecB family hemolysin secretion/activation protein [Pseudomonadales bacterium]